MKGQALYWQKRQGELYKVTLIGGAVNIALLVFKFVAGIAGHSAAMVADAVHSLSDLATDAIVLAFVNISGKPVDKSHEYGHGKFETLATAIIGMTLLAVAAGIIGSGATKVAAWIDGTALEAPGKLAFWAALLSVVSKEAVYRYTLKKSKVLKSQALEANAWHHRSDALSSVGTAIGIGGAVFLGQRWTVLDPLASVIVGLFIARAALRLLSSSIGDLTEQSLPEEVEREILQTAAQVKGITMPHELRTRRIGNNYAIEMHILLDGDTPLRQAHDKATEVERLLKKKYGEETHVAIHVEPIEDERQALTGENR